MTFTFRAVSAVYWVALTTWLAMIAAAAVAATAAFTTLPDLPLTVGALAFDATEDHGRYAAGRMLDPVFAFVDVIQVVVAPIVLLALLTQVTLLGQRWCAVANLVRGACLLGAAGVLAYRVVMVMPEMNRDLHAYWTAAESGAMVEAAAHRDAFDRRHPIASDLYAATGVLLLVAIVASASAAPPPPRRRDDGPPAPELLKRARP